MRWRFCVLLDCETRHICQRSRGDTTIRRAEGCIQIVLEILVTGTRTFRRHTIPAKLNNYNFIWVCDKECYDVTQELVVRHTRDCRVREVQFILNRVEWSNDLVKICWTELEVSRSNAKDGGQGVFLGDCESTHDVRCDCHDGVVRHHASNLGKHWVDGGHDIYESAAGDYCVCILHAVHTGREVLVSNLSYKGALH